MPVTSSTTEPTAPPINDGSVVMATNWQPTIVEGMPVQSTVNPSVWFVLSPDPTPHGGHHVPVVVFDGDLSDEEREAAVVEIGRTLGMVGQVREALRVWRRGRRQRDPMPSHT